MTPIIDEEIFLSATEHRPAKTENIKTFNLLTMLLWELCWFYNLRSKAGIAYSKKEKIFIRCKNLICQKIIPITTKDEKRQKELTQKIQKSFPDKLFL